MFLCFELEDVFLSVSDVCVKRCVQTTREESYILVLTEYNETPL